MVCFAPPGYYSPLAVNYIAMSTPQRRCIFCDGYPVTKEHMWPDWLRGYIPRTKTNFHSQSGILFRSSADTKTRLHSGDPHSMRVRWVCGPCNSGWMSRLQAQTKPILIRLLSGERYSLRKREQAMLATWITMFTMVAEYRLRPGELAAVTTEERKLFMETKRPLSNWKIWIGTIDDDSWRGRYVHTTLPVYESTDPEKRSAAGVLIPNTQTTTFVVGKLYVHVISSSVIEVEKQKISARLVERIWPLITKTIKWPLRPLVPAEAEWISMAFFRSVVDRERRLGS